MTGELTEEEKKTMMELVGKEIGKKFNELITDMHAKNQLTETRYQITQNKLDVLSSKMDRLLDYPQKNKVTLDAILAIVEKLK